MRREFSFFVADFIAREFSSPLASLNSHVKFLVAPFLVHWNSAWKLLTGDQGRTFIYSRQNCGKHPERVTAPDRTVPCFHLASPPCASCQSQRDGIHWKRQNGSSFFKWPLYQEGGVSQFKLCESVTQSRSCSVQTPDLLSCVWVNLVSPDQPLWAWAFKQLGMIHTGCTLVGWDPRPWRQVVPA